MHQPLLMVVIKSCVSCLLSTDVTFVKTFSCSCFVVSMLMLTVLCEINCRHITSWDFITLLHLVPVYLILVLPFIIFIKLHRFGYFQSHYMLHSHLAITSYSYWFDSSVMKFTFLPGFFEYLPPCHQAVGVISDGVTNRVRIVVAVFPRDLSFTPLLHGIGLLLSL